jgi:hypothetical protein
MLSPAMSRLSALAITGLLALPGCAKETGTPAPAKGAAATATTPATAPAKGGTATPTPAAGSGTAPAPAPAPTTLPPSMTPADPPGSSWGKATAAPTATALESAMRKAFPGCTTVAAAGAEAAQGSGSPARTIVGSACLVDAAQGLYRTFLWHVEPSGALSLWASAELTSDEPPRAVDYYAHSYKDAGGPADVLAELACADFATVVGEQHRKGNFVCAKTGQPWGLDYQE